MRLALLPPIAPSPWWAALLSGLVERTDVDLLWVAQQDAAVDPDDATFARSMVAHHRQALELADDALDPAVGAGAAVLDLARRIDAAQGPEIDQMIGWLEDHDEPLDAEGHDHHAMAGMVSDADLLALVERRGATFDARWLELMIAHHEGAITMAAAVQADGEDPELRALAERIVSAQGVEIAEMRGLLAG